MVIVSSKARKSSTASAAMGADATISILDVITEFYLPAIFKRNKGAWVINEYDPHKWDLR